MRLLSTLILLAVSGPALAQGAMPIRKEKGQTCPTGYYASGDFCAPFKDAKPAVARRKGESCPTGTYASSGGCVSFR
jgi:hypothetical protein